MQKPSNKVTAHLPRPQAEEQDARKAEVADESILQGISSQQAVPSFPYTKGKQVFQRCSPKVDVSPTPAKALPLNGC